MVRFGFEAVDRSGGLVRGQLDAHSRSGAVEQLLSAGQTPLSVVESAANGRPFERLVAKLGGSGGNFLVVVRELATLLNAGMNLERSLLIVRDLTAGKRTALEVGQVLERVRSGEPLSLAIRALLPTGLHHVEHLIAAGEASGHLAAVMQRLSANLQRSKQLRDRVISALTYPAFLVVTLGVVLWIVFTSVLPRLAPLFSQARAVLPLPTLIMLNVSEFLQNYGWLGLLVVIAAGVAAAYALSRQKVRTGAERFLFVSRLFLGVPAAYEAARFCRSLETMLGGGMALDRALTAARATVVNGWFREQLRGVEALVEAGTSLKISLQRCKAMPPLVAEFAAVGEETGRLAAMMRESAEVLERDVELRLDRLTALLLPVATLVMGLVVAAIMASIVVGLLAINDLARLK